MTATNFLFLEKKETKKAAATPRKYYTHDDFLTPFEFFFQKKNITQLSPIKFKFKEQTPSLSNLLEKLYITTPYFSIT